MKISPASHDRPRILMLARSTLASEASFLLPPLSDMRCSVPIWLGLATLCTARDPVPRLPVNELFTVDSSCTGEHDLETPFRDFKAQVDILHPTMEEGIPAADRLL